MLHSCAFVIKATASCEPRMSCQSVYDIISVMLICMFFSTNKMDWIGFLNKRDDNTEKWGPKDEAPNAQRMRP